LRGWRSAGGSVFGPIGAGASGLLRDDFPNALQSYRQKPRIKLLQELLDQAAFFVDRWPLQ
jgi:hypothetical protein